MKKKTSPVNFFNLSFLDIMFCGFGAVVLLVLIINSHIVSDNKIRTEELKLAVQQLKHKTNAEKRLYSSLQSNLQASQEKENEIQKKLIEVNKSLVTIEEKKILNTAQRQALKKNISALQHEIKSIDNSITEKSETVSVITLFDGLLFNLFNG
ncbi:MAG: hypothetical protein KZQ74_03055 [gamma proteobacterium symbiont of Bathyaustriella thionipta]|nr:hypothetical protein [gamma proteobacterium symbiont of Bathyaustriella thionipta]MCU7951518.1 hypothetical protein [gamma proteobacterium symbiont of Bathyaustriella thionipta]MCU7958088.1 hypothetical protein [gamma proteobacterium symbiont of Bathyaustriella thionipta]MCU7966165.1 hypothetical protein [gamma proteobacterium symbiont of Bathyaustriella thionipta]